jgi:hypothetical protein
MKIVRHCALAVFLVALCSALGFTQDPGMHPGYLHALTDLRDARAYLDRRAPSEHLNDEEQNAIVEINGAITEIKRASVDDGKNLNDHPPVGQGLARKGRYHKALELLAVAHHEVDKREDNPSAEGFRQRALQHIDAANRIVEHLIALTSTN